MRVCVRCHVCVYLFRCAIVMTECPQLTASSCLDRICTRRATLSVRAWPHERVSLLFIDQLPLQLPA